MNDAELELKRKLEEFLAFHPQRTVFGAYRGMADFVLQHGIWCKPHPFPGLRAGYRGRCFLSAYTLAATTGARYIEGFALIPPPFNLLVRHAWNVDRRRRVLDATWPDGAAAYLGVQFAVRRIRDGMSSDVLDHFQERHPLYREPWEGEPEGVILTPSLRIRRMRRVGGRNSAH